MATVFMTDPATGRCALYDEPTVSGDPKDPNSARNAPLNNPSGNLQYVYFHSDLDPMEVVLGPTNVTISHAVIPAGSGSGGSATFNNGQFYGDWTRTHVLINHNLGYVPDFFLISGSNIIHPGYPIQYDSASGRSRCVTAYATSSQIILHEYGIQSSSAMPSISITYAVMVLGAPPSPSGNILFNFNPSTEVVTMARGKFQSDRRYLQIVPGGSPFGLSTGRTIDLKNGTFRSVAPDGSYRDVVPSTFRVAFGSTTFGPDGNYNGSFLGTPSIQVQAP